MIVIADSGSTKTDWCLGNTKTNSRTVRTGRYQPFHQSVDEIKEVIASTLTPQLETPLNLQLFISMVQDVFPKNEYSENSFGAELPQKQISLSKVTC